MPHSMVAPFVHAQPGSGVPSQSLSIPSHVSGLGLISPAHSADHVPLTHAWVPCLQGGVPLPHGRAGTSSSILPSQSLSRLSQSSVEGEHAGVVFPVPAVPLPEAPPTSGVELLPEAPPTLGSMLIMGLPAVLLPGTPAADALMGFPAVFAPPVPAPLG